MKLAIHYLKPNFMAKVLTTSLLTLVFMALAFQSRAQCTLPDEEPPTAVCKDGIVLKLPTVGGSVTLPATDLDDGSYDNCPGALSFRVEELPVANTPPSTTSLTFDNSDIGQHDLALWLIDEAGNATQCALTLTIRDICVGGNSSTLACNDEVTVVTLPGESINIYPGTILVGGPYCSDYQVKFGINGNFVPNFSIDESDEGYHLVTVRDEATGNTCFGYLNIQTECTNDVVPPTAICNQEIDVWLDNPNDSLELFATQFDEGSFDNCPGNLSYFAEISPASQTPPATFTLKFAPGDYMVTLWVVDQAGNANRCWSELSVHPDCTGGSNPALACKDLVTVVVPPNTDYYPAFFLDGGAGPFCEDYEVRLDNDPFFIAVVIGEDDLGAHTFEVRDPQTGNSCTGMLEVVIDCGITNDPPTAVCLDLLSLQNITGGVEVNALELDGGSIDDCPAPLQFFIEKAPASASPPSTTSITYEASELGFNNAVLWVVDATGSYTNCLSSVFVDTCTAPPALVCNDLVPVEVQGSYPTFFYPSDILEGDYCPNQMQLSYAFPGATLQDYLVFTSSNLGLVTVQATNILTGISCWGTVQIVDDCANDNVPPSPVCNESLALQASLDGLNSTFLNATQLNDGSFDNCTPYENLSYAIEIGPVPSQTMPTTQSLEFSAVGIYNDVRLWVADALGNTNTCVVSVEVVPPKCNPDNTSPALVAPADTTITSDAMDAMNLDLQDYAQLDSYFGTAYTWDYCGFDTLLQSNTSILDNCGNLVTLIRSFEAIDNAGNTRTGEQSIHISRDYSINLPSDFRPGDAGVPGDVTVLSSNGLQFGITYTDINSDFNCDSLPDFIVRKWDIINLCDFNIPEDPFILPFHDEDNDGNTGDPYTVWVVNDSIYLLENGLPIETLGPTTGIFKYKQYIQYNNDDTIQLSVVGTVFMDTLANCTKDANEPILQNWKVRVTGLTSGEVYTTTTDANGHFEINGICPNDETVELSLDVPFNYGQTCPTTYTLQTTPSVPVVQDVPVQLNPVCDLMEVDLATPFLRRCFPNTYTVSYTNYSANTIEAAYVEVQLDEFMSFTGSSLPGTLVTNNLYNFPLGDLAPGQSGNFTVDFNLSCDAELGQTHCTEAFIYPDTLCPVNATWSGANIEVAAICDNDQVQLSIKNTGSAMNAPLDFIVVEDVIMFDGGSFNLGAGDTYELPPITANGATYRLEAQQATGHPYPGNVAVALEACNGLNTVGLVNLFPLENPNPFITNDCRENEGSFDPNDKSALPLGYGEEHLIYRNTDIEYLIRFQNTGTDTAFNVVILDTLSSFLDPVSIRPGAASHAYAFEVLPGNVLRFSFNQIMLPDSSDNQAASNGFIQFRAKQKPDLAIGTVIENKAAIYFDFNEPIITNQVFHTIGEGFIQVNATTEAGDNRPQPKVYPNPSFGAVVFELPETLDGKAQFKLFNPLGQLVRNDAFDGKRYQFERKGLAPGIYTYALESNGIRQYSGKVILE